MILYQKQITIIILLLIVFIFSGLVVVSHNMEKITLRNGQDFLYLTTKSKGVWEFRFLGTSLVINKEQIQERWQGVKNKVQRLKHRQEVEYPIK